MEINRFDNRHISLELNRKRLVVRLCALFATFNLNCQSFSLHNCEMCCEKHGGLGAHSMGALKEKSNIFTFALNTSQPLLDADSSLLLLLLLSLLLYHKFMRAIILINIH